MLVCSQCGSGNELGKVFCDQCGGKLELSNFGTAEISASENVSFFHLHGMKIVVALIVALLATIGSGLWPNTKPVGSKGTRNDRRRADGKLSLMARAGKAKTVVKITEKDINGYFEHDMAPRMKLKSVSVNITDSHIKVRVIKQLYSCEIAKKPISILTSSDYICVADDNDVLTVKNATFGHLPVPGPVKDILVKSILAKLNEQRKWKSLKYVAGIEYEDGEIAVLVKR